MLYAELEEIRRQAGKQSPNGRRGSAGTLCRRLSRRPRARDLLLILAVLILVATIPRSCEVIFKPAARIQQAEAQIREHGAAAGWAESKIEETVARLHERYQPEASR
jgi:hypothetical protein